MKILLGKEQFKSMEEFKEIQIAEKRKEFYKEFMKEMAFAVIGGFIGCFALIGFITYMGWS